MRIDYRLYGRMIETLALAATTFRHYEECHRAKGTEESDLKAERNRKMAEDIEAVLKVAEG